MDVLLIIISSAGLLHGLAFAVYLCFVKKRRSLSNLLLSLLLIFMALFLGALLSLFVSLGPPRKSEGILVFDKEGEEGGAWLRDVTASESRGPTENARILSPYCYCGNASLCRD